MDNKQTNYEVRELKKFSSEKGFFGLYLVLDKNNRYVATVKFDFIKNVCNVFDVLEKITNPHEEVDIFDAVKGYIAEEILQHEEEDDVPPPSEEFLNAIF